MRNNPSKSESKMNYLRSSISKKATESGQNEKTANVKDVTVYVTTPSTTKAKRKIYDLFSKIKYKSGKTPTTPKTLEDADEDPSCACIDHGDHIVAVIPVGRASPPRKGKSVATATIEKAARAKCVLTELEMADANSGLNGSGEGTELMLPTLTCKIDENHDDDNDDDNDEQALKNDIKHENDTSNLSADETLAKEKSQNTGGDHKRPKASDDESACLEENPAELDPLNCLMVSEEDYVEGDPQHQEPPTSPIGSAVKIDHKAPLATLATVEEAIEQIWAESKEEEQLHETPPRASSPRKAKRKKFGFLSKIKSMSGTTPTTPETVEDPDEDLCCVSYDHGDHVVAVIPIGDASPPQKEKSTAIAMIEDGSPSEAAAASTEKDPHETLPVVRSLLAELDTANADSEGDQQQQEIPTSPIRSAVKIDHKAVLAEIATIEEVSEEKDGEDHLQQHELPADIVRCQFYDPSMPDYLI